MKIAIDASRANRIKKTGVEWYAFYIIQNILKISDPNDQFILYFQDKINTDWNISTQGNIRTKVLNWPPKYFWTHLRLSYQIYKDSPDILFVPAHVLPIVRAKKNIITIHDVAFKNFKKVYSLKENLYQEFAIRYALKYADKIIVPSFFTKEQILKFYNVKQSKIVVIYHGINKHEFNKNFTDNQITKVLLKYDLHNPYFLFIGRIELKKNLIKVIKAFELFKTQDKNNYDFVLIGKPGFGYKYIKEVIKQCKYKYNIVELGWIEQDELIILLQKAHCFVYPSVYEGFGIPILEAFAAGTPVITSEETATAELAQDSALLVDSKDIGSIYNALIAITTSDELRRNLIYKGKKRIQDFSWEKCAQQTYDLIKSL